MTGGNIWERCAQAIDAPDLVTNPDYATRPKNRTHLSYPNRMMLISFGHRLFLKVRS
jgi:hypothetical protein